MFTPNQYFWRQEVTGYDMLGEINTKSKVRERCAVVNQRIETQKTSVREDVSGSGGNAKMKRSKVRWLVEKSSGIARGDVVWLVQRSQNKFLVEDLHPRYTTTGKLDHFEVDLATWA